MYNPTQSNVQGGATNVYGRSLKARAIAHVVAETDIDRFLFGTTALNEDNEICLIEASASEGVKLVSLFPHKREIWSITSCSYDASRFFTVYNDIESFKTSLWRIEGSSIEEQCELKGHQGLIKPILCDPSGESDYVISLDDNNIRLWQGLETSSPTATKTFGGLTKLTAGCINPNISNQLATANDVHIKGWDFRSGKESFTIDKAHSDLIRDVDFNPNKPYNLLSAGDDCKLKFWDTRHTKEPVKMFAGQHNHWIWSAKFNKSKDNLVITSSSDNSVNLWNVYSISSAVTESPTSDPATNDGQSKPQSGGKKNKRKEDRLIKKFEEHDDSVYSACWGSDLPHNYVFASLSYDGRVVINNVPKEYTDLLEI
eukprot:gene5658-6533_t